MITVDVINNESIEVTVTDNLVTVNVISSQTIDGLIAAASQAQVDAGTAAGVFVSPLTLENADQLTASAIATKLKAYITDSEIQTLTDGASVNFDHDDWGGRMFFIETSQATPTWNILKFGKGGHISVKKTISGSTTVTIQGTGYKFVDMDTKALPAASVDITLSDTINFGFEISLFHAGYTDGGSTVINVKKG